MMPRTILLNTALTIAILAAAIQPALAERDGHGGRGERGWHGDIRHFQAHDMHRWRGGRWFHGRHGGYLGWWWVAAGLWYFYPSPVYPYPDPYVPPAVVEQQPPVYIQQAPAGAAAPHVTRYWYYCEPTRAYYPYVASCPSGWKQVPATPADVPRQ